MNIKKIQILINDYLGLERDKNEYENEQVQVYKDLKKLTNNEWLSDVLIESARKSPKSIDNFELYISMDSIIPIHSIDKLSEVLDVCEWGYFKAITISEGLHVRFRNLGANVPIEIIQAFYKNGYKLDSIKDNEMTFVKVGV